MFELINLPFFIGGLVFLFVFIWMVKIFESYKFKHFVNKYLLLTIPFAAGISYLLLSFNFGVIHHQSGYTINWLRYLDWAITTSITIYVTNLVIEKDLGLKLRGKVAIIIPNLIMLTTGLIAHFIGGTTGLLIYFTGVIAFIIVIGYWLIPIIKSEETINVFTKLLISFTIFLWSIYPIIFILGKAFLNVIDPESYDIFILSLDLTAKIIFSVYVAKSIDLIIKTEKFASNYT